MKRILIFIFNWSALLTYFLWATIGLTIMGIQRRRDINETLFEFIKEMLTAILIAILLPILFIVSDTFYVGLSSKRNLLFEKKLSNAQRYSVYDSCLACHLIVVGKLPITSFGDFAFGDGLEQIRRSYKFTIGNLCNNMAVKRDRSLI
jgi:hypothetical protein